MIHVRASVALLCALFALSCSRTSTNSEVVELRDGSHLPIEVLETKGPGEFGTPGQGPVTGIELQFSRSGQEFEWERTLARGEEWVSTPEIVDFVDDAPVVVFPVVRQWGCAAYDYPQEGLVAERYEGKRWRRVEFKSLPANLRANVSLRGFRGDPYGKGLSELVLFYREFDESCEELHAAPDPVRDATVKQMAAAVASQPVIEPGAIQSTELPEELKSALEASTIGKWSRGFVADSCSGVIDHIDSFFVVNAPVHAANEVRWVAKDGDRIRVRVRQSVVNVYCDEQSVFIVSQEWNPNETIVYRHGRDGSFRNAVRLSTAAIRAQHPVGTINALSVDGDRVTFLWAKFRSCKQANDQDCWAYSAQFPPAK